MMKGDHHLETTQRAIQRANQQGASTGIEEEADLETVQRASQRASPKSESTGHDSDGDAQSLQRASRRASPIGGEDSGTGKLSW